MFFTGPKKQTLIHNMTSPKLYKFLKSTSSINLSGTKLIHLLNVAKQFCQNNQNIIFTVKGRANKSNYYCNKISYISKVEELLNDDNTVTRALRSNYSNAVRVPRA